MPASEVAALYSHSTDAMVVAATLNRPTLNGMSTFLPPGWDLMHPERLDYADRILAEAARHGLREGLCALDLEALRWSGPGWTPTSIAPDFLPVLRPRNPLAAYAGAPGLREMLAGGWGVPEVWGTWTVGDSAHLRIRLPPGGRGGGVLELRGRGYALPGGTQAVRATVGRTTNVHWAEAHFTATTISALRIPFAAEDREDDVLDIRLSIASPTSPADLGRSGDSRRLGLGLLTIALDE